VKYQVWGNSGEYVGVYSSRKRAKSKVDKMDNAYGGYHYYIKEIEA
jgi:hypothetical protein